MNAEPALTISRIATADDKVVYMAVANKPLKYGARKSRIAYIGVTTKGAARIAQSAADKAAEMLTLHGVKHLDFHVLTFVRRRNVKMWRELERGLLIAFKNNFGEVPKCNRQGKSMKWQKERNYYSEARLNALVTMFEAAP
jgi:predicted GIY-YIG superfamily endonuclease